MALSPEDKQRLVDLSRKKPEDTDEVLNRPLGGEAAVPLPVGQWRPSGRPRWEDTARRVLRWGLYLAIPAAILGALGTYVYRNDLYTIDFGEVFGGNPNRSILERFRHEVDLAKRKRVLLDEARGAGFANKHMEAYAKAGQVLRLDAENAEAKHIQRASLDKQVVYARGALAAGDVDTAIDRVRPVLAIDRANGGARAVLDDAAQILTRQAAAAAENGAFGRAVDLVLKAEAIVPGYPPAVALHAKLLQHHLRRADQLYVQQQYLSALDEIVLARRLDPDNRRAYEVFEKIEQRVGYPDIKINSVMEVRGAPRVFATIDGKTYQLEPGDQAANVVLDGVNVATGDVRFKQVYTNERRTFTKVPGSRGEWFAPTRPLTPAPPPPPPAP